MERSIRILSVSTTCLSPTTGLAVAVSHIFTHVPVDVKDESLNVVDALKALHAIGQLTPAYVKLLESVGISERLEEVEQILKERSA